ncbi:cytochrome c oxidase subunit 3 [Niabella drilacis]|uniref:Cytochrome c oxidase subunit 3 n=1 Tax=Niabella drilacis (strain DSM 25811 / CCM 8410 / CCUG 62505 / LMG 26954 / E90) TaxID=1285928 RepID=A0A1G6YLY5_NIADE|nr:heme-copper oxidase subunit III [Niabella drilacis]SDD91419.1 cytochrome c oxidase subunit 3 [Niabella drilacis]
MNTSIVSEQQHRRLHPHKFALWVAIASILMMFAGLTSAFIVKSNQSGWRTFVLPNIFWVSTVLILTSSLTMLMAIRAFKNRALQQYRRILGVTFLLGVAFVICQVIGFEQLWNNNVQFKGASGAGQFFYAIAGLHAVHVIGGIIALLVIFLKSITGKTKSYDAVPVEVMGMYWHFVDLLWLYLMIFFMILG